MARNSTPAPILTLTLSKIREYVPSDAAALAPQCNNHNISQWMTNGFPHPYTIQDAHDWIDRNISIAADRPPQNFLIVDPTTDSAIGGIGIKPGEDVSTHTAEIGYWLGEEYWGKGIMSEALPAFSQWVWRNREVERLWAGVFDGNGASQRLLEKAGYRYEGLMRGHVRKEGIVKDLHVYGITRADTTYEGSGCVGQTLQCEKCREKNVTYNQARTYSADEPKTTSCECFDFGNKWKFS